MRIKLLILDVDGVITDGTKIYNSDHMPVGKRYMCKDFTAIKRFAAAGVEVIMISGDGWNRNMAAKRNIDFYCTRDKRDGLDKSQWLEEFRVKYKVEYDDMFFVGDDYFDFQMFTKLKYTACPSDAPQTIKDNSWMILDKKGGEGCLVELYDKAVASNFITPVEMQKVVDLDKLEQTSSEMSNV